MRHLDSSIVEYRLTKKLARGLLLKCWGSTIASGVHRLEHDVNSLFFKLLKSDWSLINSLNGELMRLQTSWKGALYESS